ncbi:MAG TPA: UbiD family decarboxylase, partial [Dehalococcoidia bacterium]|nr:UbiD family decarboxylase [Dehalococcoidia bacterium]
MAFLDLRSFLGRLEALGELARIEAEVDPELEVTAITTRVVREGGPALLFRNMRGSAYPLAVNLFGSHRRIELALGRHPQAVGEELASLAELLNPPSLKGLWRARRSLGRLLALRTIHSGKAPCQGVEEAPDLSSLPVLRCWPGDGGPFITFPLVLTRDPLTARSNLGIYRMQLYGRDRTGMHWQIAKGGGLHYWQAERDGQPLAAAAILGADPALMLAAVLPLPEGLSEVAFSGLLRGRPTRMAPCRSIPLSVPASAEVVLEGFVPPYERAMEGPFGDHFGHYSAPAPFPVFNVIRITRRASPILVASVVGRPPQEDRYLGEAASMMLLPLLKLTRPELKDLWAYYQAGFHNLLVASVEARYPGAALKTALGLLGEGQLALTKVLILVDPQVDVRDFGAVLRAIGQHLRPEDGFTLLTGAPVDTLDFTGPRLHEGGKMVLDATARNGVGAHLDAPLSSPMTLDHLALPGVRRFRLWESLLAV